VPIHGPFYNLPTQQIQKTREFRTRFTRIRDWHHNGLVKVDMQIKSLCYKRQLFNPGQNLAGTLLRVPLRVGDPFLVRFLRASL
jgi:hypothetical protein